MDRLKKERIGKKEGWIGVDLDGTLAEFPDGYGIDNIGKPIEPMIEHVRHWLSEGREVRIFTARMGNHNPDIFGTVYYIWKWCEENGLPRLPVTNQKDVDCIEIWDDRAVQVNFNEGTPVGDNYIYTQGKII